METSALSIVESEPVIQIPEETPTPATLPEVVAPEVREIVEDICETTANEMTEKASEPAASSPECPTNETAPPAAEEAESAKQLDFTPETSPVREIKKSGSKKDCSPAKEKVSRRKAAVRNKDHSNKEQLDSNPIPAKARNGDDRNNNNTRRQSTESDVVTDSKSEGSADSSKGRFSFPPIRLERRFGHSFWNNVPSVVGWSFL